MPLVKVEDTKGLYQTSGSGMQMVDSQIQPASETIRVAVINLDCVADTSDSLNGKYFDISSTTTNYRIWFDNDNGGATAPSAYDAKLKGNRTLVECKTQSTNDNAAAIAAELELLFESSGLTGVFDADDAAADGNICLFVRIPGQMAALPDAGTSGFTVTYTDGSGQAALNPLKRVSVLEAPTVLGGNTVVAQNGTYTLASGSFVGQEKLIVRNDAIAIAQTVEIATICIDDSSGIDATATAVFPADTGTGEDASARVLDLIWIGDRWLQRGQNTVGASTGANKTITGILGT